MSADTAPITPARFAAALRDLPLASLHLKVLELRNSIAHLDYSNEQLRPFAEGAEPVLGGGGGARGDPDCADAIRENEAVIARMQERVALVRAEVEARGRSWREFQAKDELDAEAEAEAEAEAGGARRGPPLTNGHAAEGPGRPPPPRHPAWADGTFQTGTVRDGEVRAGAAPAGGSLSDEELRRMLEERLATGGGGDDDDDDDAEGGMHL